jgi:hypothetical protein
MKITKFKDIPRFVHGGNYVVNVPWSHLERHLEGIPECDLDPDFQRGHVWTKEKQQAYVEFILKGGKSSRAIYFNHPGWMTDFKGKFEIVDGKQRIEAARAFLRDEVEVFGSVFSEFTDNLRLTETDFIVHVNNLQTRAEVLEWYLHLNAGGVMHTTDELDRVRELLRLEQNK